MVVVGIVGVVVTDGRRFLARVVMEVVVLAVGLKVTAGLERDPEAVAASSATVLPCCSVIVRVGVDTFMTPISVVTWLDS